MNLPRTLIDLYRHELQTFTQGNGLNTVSAIECAIRRAIQYKDLPDIADNWEQTAIDYTIRAAHAARMLGYIER